MQNKPTMLLLVMIILGTALVTASITATAILLIMDDKDSTKETVNSAPLSHSTDAPSSTSENFGDIYAKFTEFNQIFNQPDITEEQKSTAIKNARSFIAFCEDLYKKHNEELPEWNEQEKDKVAKIMAQGNAPEYKDHPAPYEYAYASLKEFSRHPDYIEDTSDFYNIVQDKNERFALSCSNGSSNLPYASRAYYGSGFVPTFYVTYREDASYDGSSAPDETTSLYDVWGDDVAVSLIGF